MAIDHTAFNGYGTFMEGVNPTLANDSIWLLSKDYIIIVLIALLVALPTIWLITSQVKMMLPNTIGFDSVGVVSGVILILSIVAITIASQTLKSTRTNPVDSLQAE